MEEQLLGMAYILFDILLCVIEVNSRFWIPIIDGLPWNILGLVSGIDKGKKI